MTCKAALASEPDVKSTPGECCGGGAASLTLPPRIRLDHGPAVLPDSMTHAWRMCREQTRRAVAKRDAKRGSESGAGSARGGTLEQGVGRQARVRRRLPRVRCTLPGGTGRASRPWALAPASRAGHGPHAHLGPTCVAPHGCACGATPPERPGHELRDPSGSRLCAQGDRDGPPAHRTPHLESRPHHPRMAAHHRGGARPTRYVPVPRGSRRPRHQPAGVTDPARGCLPPVYRGPP
jgi:hypothetical protein